MIYRQTIIKPLDNLWSFVGSFLGIGLIGYLQSLRLPTYDNVFLIGSFGASAVLIYGATNSPLAQPRNLVGGHLICALIGVTIANILPQESLLWLASALAVSLSIIAMQITRTLHPPGGATALIAQIGSTRVKELGYWYVINPVLTGSLILLIVALVSNNLSKNRSYPYRSTPST